jgi:hypothetical protein
VGSGPIARAPPDGSSIRALHDATDPQGLEPAAGAGDAALSSGWGGDGETAARVRALLDETQETARGVLEAEEALHLVRQRFEHTEDPEARGDLAAGALDQVERQLNLAAEHRLHLDGVETELWASRNHLEQFLIQTRGIDWWHARGNTRNAGTPGQEN